MMGFLVRLLIAAAGLWAASEIVPGVEIDDTRTLLLAALIFGVVNAFVKPVLFWLTLPLTIVTLGLFLLVLNGAMIGLTAWFLSDMVVTGLIPAVLAAIVVSIVSWIGAKLFDEDGKMKS
ncbi:MAG: hypothetical protein CMK06_11445 [Ponticaulis sp.]|nr:hypothetical protein [Ponticaulis sp.]|tara:strand:+ start:5066 stop:5425 length:360 start_codon:yes stop_codon:yes gene_type:complete